MKRRLAKFQLSPTTLPLLYHCNPVTRKHIHPLIQIKCLMFHNFQAQCNLLIVKYRSDDIN